MERKKILLIGAGAIGSVYAYAISHSCHDFAIVANAERINRYINEGIYFCNKKINCKFITPNDEYGKADIILITVKNYDLTNALDIIRPSVGKKTIIIPLLNGITSEDITASYFSTENVLYGFYIGHTSTREGNRIFQDGDYLTVIGDYPYSNAPFSNKLIKAINILSSCGIHVEGRTDMKNEIWKKFAVNICLNQTTAYFKSDYGNIISDKIKMNFFNGLASEIKAIAIAEKVKDAFKIDEYVRDILYQMNPRDKSSMAQDVEYGRKTEIDDFAGEVIRLSKKHNIICPYNMQVFNHFHE